MRRFSTDKAGQFARPTQLPTTAQEHATWQRANQSWWEAHPMRYDWKDALAPDEFSAEFYAEIDRRFFGAARAFLPPRRGTAAPLPFDQLIDFDQLPGERVLEIGVGNGSHAQLLAAHARAFTGIDLTDYAVRSTTRRLHLAGLPHAQILRADAEALPFANGAFERVWSWGVIHHAASTEQILAEIRRVLVPGGRFTAMVYHRGYWNYYVVGALLGLLRGRLLREGLHRSVQHTTDGALARYYTPHEWRALLEKHGFAVQGLRVMGAKAEVLPLPGGRLKSALLRLLPDALGRLLTNHLRMGSMLVSDVVKVS